MKKMTVKRSLIVLLAIVAISALCLISCKENSSVGIIGGADGPTAIFVATPNGGGDVQEFFDNMPLIKRLYLGGVLQYLGGTSASIPTIIAMYLLIALVGYALGSLNFGIIISKLIYKDDIRKYGSGNAGTTNMLRTFGKGAALGTILGDALKVVAAIVIANFLVGEILGGGYVAGLFAIIGHVYPAYYGFKGGKGVVTAAITILMLEPSIFLVELTVFVVVVAIWRYISLGSILSAALYPMITYAAYNGPSVQFVFALLIAIFIIVLHRTNIQRLIDGKENKLSFRKSGKKMSSDSENKGEDK